MCIIHIIRLTIKHYTLVDDTVLGICIEILDDCYLIMPSHITACRRLISQLVDYSINGFVGICIK